MSLPFVMLFLHEPVLYIICYLLLSLGTMMRTLCNTKQGWWISSEDGSSNKYAFGKMLVISSEPPSSWRDCSFSLAKNTTICAWWVLWRGAIWLELGWDHRWTPKGACESDDFRSWMFRGQATYSGVFFFLGYELFLCMQGRKVAIAHWSCCANNLPHHPNRYTHFWTMATQA